MTARDAAKAGLFSPTILGFLVASVIATFALSVVLATIGGGDDTPFRASAQSPSAIGHKGFYTLLQRLDLPVALDRYAARTPARAGDLLIVAEPGRNVRSFGRGAGTGAPPNVLVVLPKWYGTRDILHDGWVIRVGLLGLDTPRYILDLVDRPALVTRQPPPTSWATNTIGATPTLDGQVQLIEHSTLRPLIGTQDRMLLGERVVDGRRIWVLADPDPIENHGIATPANARFAVALVAAARGGTGRVVFDETVHGTVAPERNILQLLFKFPYVIVTIEVLAALVLLLLATTSRFGGAEVPPAPFSLGKLRLIETIAALMDRAGHQGVILRRYVSVTLVETGRALHAPKGLDEPALAAWLDRVGTTRGVADRASAIAGPSGTGATRLSLSRLFDQAHAAYRLKRDLLDGPGRRQDNS